MLKINFLCFVGVCILLIAGCSNNELYKNPDLPVEKRVNNLLKQMTLEEKTAQLRCIYRNTGRIVHNDSGLFDINLARKNLLHGIGHIARPSEIGGIVRVIKYTNDIQRYLRDSTRLGIPAIFHEEGLHGFAADSVTMYPSATALASTWNTDLVEKVFAATALEIRSRGSNQALTPVLDIARDPRWGRFEETYGEDPYLTSEMAIAAVNGLQVDRLPLAPGKVIATLKHFVAHGQPEGGNNVAPPNADEQTLHEIHLLPFRRTIKNTNVLSVMASYNEVNGIPLHASHQLLNDILREEWHFNGTVVSDYGGINNLIDRHRVASSKKEAALLAIQAGVDIELPEDDTYNLLEDLVKEGALNEKLIDRAVARVLRQKFLLGLFENPFTNDNQGLIIQQLEKNRVLAEEAAIQSITLLENNGILPLRNWEGKKIAVIGPNAGYTVLGGYSGTPLHRVSTYEGIKQYTANKADVQYQTGCRITKSEPNWNKNEVIPVEVNEEKKLIEQAVGTARNTDIIILCLGDHESVSREAWSEKHLGDRPSIRLVGLQEELFLELKKTGKPIITLLFTNGPRDIAFLKDKSDAVLQCWYLGQETGNAVAKILFGERSPSGRLVASFPRSAGHIPAVYNHKPSARRGYLFDDISPLYPFGYGLGYSEIAFGEAKLSKERIAPGEITTFSVEITNKGPYKTDEVVMLFIRDETASATRPVKELKGFKKVALERGESKTVSFQIDTEMLSFYHPLSDKWIVEPGEFTLMAGLNGPFVKLILTK